MRHSICAISLALAKACGAPYLGRKHQVGDVVNEGQRPGVVLGDLVLAGHFETVLVEICELVLRQACICRTLHCSGDLQIICQRSSFLCGSPISPQHPTELVHHIVSQTISAVWKQRNPTRSPQSQEGLLTPDPMVRAELHGSISK